MDINGFEILSKLGEGQKTIAWKARQVSLARIVTIKALKPEYASNPGDVSTFAQDARKAAEAQHRNIVQIYDIGDAAGIPFSVMEYVGSQTLADLLQAGPLKQKQALQITATIADALHAAWSKASVIHRGLRPDSIRIDEEGSIKISHLGISLPDAPDPVARARQIKNGAYYLAPEQALGGTVDCRTDMYALGAMLYHMLTGQKPFANHEPLAAVVRQVKGQLPDPRRYVPAIPNGTVVLMTKLMMKAPEDRYPDWEQALRGINAMLAGRIMVGKTRAGAISTIADISLSITALNKQPAPGKLAGRQKAAAKKITLAKKTPTQIPVKAPTPPQVVRQEPPPPQVIRMEPDPVAPRNPAPPPPPASRKTPPEAAPGRLRKAEAVRRRYSHDETIPLGLRVTAWGLLLFWWTFLAYQLRSVPTTPPVTSRWPPRPQPTVAVAALPAAHLPTRRPPTPTVEDALAPSERRSFDELCRAVVGDLVADNQAAARRSIHAALQAAPSTALQAEINKAAEILVEAATAEHLVISALKRATGSQLTIHLGDSSRIVIPRSFSGTEMNGDMVKQVGKTAELIPFTLSIFEIDPRDRTELIGPADSPAKALMKCLFLIKANDMSAARGLAAQAGPFENALTDTIGNR